MIENIYLYKLERKKNEQKMRMTIVYGNELTGVTIWKQATN